MLEEITLLSSLALVAQGKISFTSAFAACFLGICIGNTANYFIGHFFSRLYPENRFLKKHDIKISQFKNSNLLTYWIVASKLVPGARLITYFAAGFLRYPFWKFELLTCLSAFGVTALVLFGGEGLRQLFETHWIISVAIIGLLLIILGFALRKAKNDWQK